MRWWTLLQRADAELNSGPSPYRDFDAGGSWMAAQLYRRLPTALPLSQPDYNRAGIVKYSLSLIIAGLTSLLTMTLGPLAVLLGVSSFYVVEVHFLFLFQLLAEGRKRPYLSSIGITYELGLFHCVANVLPIALSMITGLLDRKDPFRGWHVGCLAVVLWYVDYRKNQMYGR